MSERVPPAVRDAVRERDGNRCFRCGASVFFSPYSVHHRQLRSGGVKHEMWNLVLLCGTGVTGCHGAVHGSRTPGNTGYGVAAAREDGFIISKFDTSPHERPVRHHSRGLVLLGADGSINSAEGAE